MNEHNDVPEFQPEAERETAQQAANAPKPAETPRKKGAPGLYFKVSEKGGLSVYGLGRFPVTLYKEQWLRLLEKSDDIRAFIRENEPKLKSKPAPE